MRYHVLAIVSAMLAACPVSAGTLATNGIAKNALTVLGQLNLVTLDPTKDTILRHDVEGKAFIGGNLGNSSNTGSFTIAKGGDGSPVTSPLNTLSVVGNAYGQNVNVDNGTRVYQAGERSAIAIGGNSLGSFNLNRPGALTVGGNLNAQNFNPNSSKTATYGGSATGLQAQDAAYVTRDASLATGGAKDLAASLGATLATYTADMQTLAYTLGQYNSTVLDKQHYNVTFSTVTVSSNNLTFNAVNSGNGAAIFNIDGSILTGNRTVTFAGAGALPVVVNVTGASSYNIALNGNNAALGSKIIWNFGTATGVNFNGQFDGTVLAPLAKITQNTQINGTVVAAYVDHTVNGGGEIHQQTYIGGDSVIGSFERHAAPESATWAMMIVGFGAVGQSMRRRRRVLAIA